MALELAGATKEVLIGIEAKVKVIMLRVVLAPELVMLSAEACAQLEESSHFAIAQQPTPKPQSKKTQHPE